MTLLNVINTTLAYDDSGSTQNPTKRTWDWQHLLLGIDVVNAKSDKFQVDPGASLTVFNGTRSTSIDNTTAFTVTLSPLSSQRYRVTKTAGTSPALRTARSVNMTGNVMALTALANGALQISLGSGGLAGTDFSLIQVGDQVFVPGTSTGDSAGPFNASNEGLWTVIGNSAVSGIPNRLLTLARINSGDPTGVSETVTPASSGQFLAFSSTGVQPNDSVEFASSLWSKGLQKNFIVALATPDWFEFISSTILPLDSGIQPTSTGLVFYTNVKRFVRIEADQEAAVQYNGDSGQLNRIAPLAPADVDQVGWQEKWGPTWSLTVVNRTNVQLNLRVFSAE